MSDSPYRIIRDYGTEGWAFDKEPFATAEAALARAMVGAHSTFQIVKIIEFRALDEPQCKNQEGGC